MNTESKTANLMLAVNQQVKQWVDVANAHFASRIPYPDVSFRASGTRAGTAFLHQGRLNFHRTLLSSYPDTYFDDVIPHEVAHWVVHCQFGRVPPHGQEWKSVMQDVFAVPAKATHNMDTSVLKSNVWAYRCGCSRHQLTTRRHRAVQRNKARYLCRKCGDVLTEVVE